MSHSDRSDRDRERNALRLAREIPLTKEATEVILDRLVRTTDPGIVQTFAFGAERVREAVQSNPARFGLARAEAAARIGVSPRTFDRMVAAGEIRAAQIPYLSGGECRFCPEAVEKLRAERAKRNSRGGRED